MSRVRKTAPTRMDLSVCSSLEETRTGGMHLGLRGRRVVWHGIPCALVRWWRLAPDSSVSSIACTPSLMRQWAVQQAENATFMAVAVVNCKRCCGCMQTVP